MIKPVYFGNSKEDKFLFDLVNKLEDFNFSDWVKNRLCEEFDVRIVRMDFGINKKKKIEDKRVDIDREIKIDKDEKMEIKIDQWSL